MQTPTYNFADTLPDLDAGVFLEKVSSAVQAVALGAVLYGAKGKTGKVTIELTISRIGDSNQVNVDHRVTQVRPTKRGKLTEEDTTSTALYVAPGGAVSVMPHTQGKLWPETEHA